MPTYSLHRVQASVMLADAPMGYTPLRGPSVNLQLRYNHREENQPQVFTFANLGAKWTANWIAYLEEVPWQFFIEGGVLKYAEPEHVAVHVPQGGVERFVYPNADGVYPRHYRSGAVLALVSSDPIRYERRHTDGSTEVYDVSDGGVPATYSADVYIADNVVVIDYALLFGYNSWSVLLRHERGHVDDSLR